MLLETLGTDKLGREQYVVIRRYGAVMGRFPGIAMDIAVGRGSCQPAKEAA